jgi:hypothetical protein
MGFIVLPETRKTLGSSNKKKRTISQTIKQIDVVY